MPGEAPAPHREGVGATYSSGSKLLPQREQMLGVQWERKWGRKARAYMSTAGFLAQGQTRITLPKNSNKQTNKKSASKIRQFLVGTAGIRHLQNLEVGENARSDWRQNQLCGFAGSPKSESYAFQHLHQHCLSSFLSTDGGKTFPGRHTHCPGWWGPESVAQPAHTDTCLASRI